MRPLLPVLFFFFLADAAVEASVCSNRLWLFETLFSPLNAASSLHRLQMRRYSSQNPNVQNTFKIADVRTSVYRRLAYFPSPSEEKVAVVFAEEIPKSKRRAWESGYGMWLHYLKVFDAKTGTEIFQTRLHFSPGKVALAFSSSEDRMAVKTGPREVLVFSLLHAEPMQNHLLPNENDSVEGLEFNSQGDLVVTPEKGEPLTFLFPSGG